MPETRPSWLLNALLAVLLVPNTSILASELDSLDTQASGKEFARDSVAALSVGRLGGREMPGAGETPDDNNFEVVLEGFGDQKIAVIKIVRSATGLGLKEAKELVESAPAVIKRGMLRPEADDLVAALASVGAKASVRSTESDDTPKRPL